MTFNINISIEHNENHTKVEYKIPIVQNLDVEQRREHPFDPNRHVILEFDALPYSEDGEVFRIFHPDQMDPRKRIEMLEERKAEIDKEIQAITDAQWSWRDDLGR